MREPASAAPVPVLLMSHSLGHGGGERQLAITALALDRTRFTPHVAACEGGYQADQLRDAGVPFFDIRLTSLTNRTAVRESLRLRRYIRGQGIRLVQTFDYSMNVFGIPVARSVPGVVTLSSLRCNMELIPSRYRWLNHFAHRISRGVVVNSEALKSQLVTEYQIPAKKIFVCYNGVDTGVFHPRPRERVAGLESAPLVVGTVCVLRPEKNLPLLLEAFADVAVSTGAGMGGARLLVVGSGPEEGPLKALAERLGIAESCVFQPSTPDVPHFLAGMDIFVLPSLTEGLSNAIMEAMASGCCVLASNVGGAQELIEHGVTGLLFPSRDQHALVQRLLSVAGDADMRGSLASAAAERMQTAFSLNGAVTRMQQVYDSFLSGLRF